MTPMREQPLILVVDDEAGQRLLAGASLRQGGFTVLEAEDGQQALALFQREPPDIVLLDVVMPGLDGFAVCEALRDLPGGRHLPIVMVTGLDDVESIERAYQAGATDFITKPIQWLVLHHRVRYILRASQALLGLRESEERFRTLVQAAGSIILVVDRQHCLLECNRAAERFFALRKGELLGAEWRDVLPLTEEWIVAEDSRNWESTIRALDGDERAVLWNISRFADAEGLPAGWVIVGQDITERRRSEEIMRKLSWVVEQNPISILITDINGHIEYANPKFVEVSGYALNDILGNTPYFLQTNTLSLEQRQHLQQTIASGSVWQGELCNRRKDGEFFWEAAHVSAIHAPNGAITHFIWLREDITARKQAEERIRFLAYYDHLTHLPNRVLLQERLRSAIEAARSASRLLALMFLDLDQFKRINDTLGHGAGDTVLQEAAHRLQECVRQNDYIARAETPMGQDLLARLGGDEFVILLTEINHADDAIRVAQRIQIVIARPFLVQGSEVFIGCSIGIALFPADGDDMEVLLKNADTALYYAKDQGRNNYQLYADWMNVAAVQRFGLESRLRRALENRELALHYQPQVSLRNGHIVGVEALLRWRSPELGLVPPLDFIPIAEETGMIVPIGDWVLRTACEQALAWGSVGLAGLRMAVNLSARQFEDVGLPTRIAKILAETGLDPHRLEVEITESLLMKEGALGILQALKALGVHLSIDDFGTGYSNLGYLRRFPIDRLKIDKSFAQDINHQQDRNAIAAAIIAMARSLRLGVIAEGVETEAQLELLQELRCEEMQGYYFSRPCAPQELEAILRDYVPTQGEAVLRDSRLLLLVDEDPATLMILRRVALQVGARLRVASSTQEGLNLMANQSTVVVFWNPACDPEANGDFPQRARECQSAVACIALIDADSQAALHSNFTPIIDAEGVLLKPLTPAVVRALLRTTAARMAAVREPPDQPVSPV